MELDPRDYRLTSLACEDQSLIHVTDGLAYFLMYSGEEILLLLESPEEDSTIQLL